MVAFCNIVSAATAYRSTAELGYEQDFNSEPASQGYNVGCIIAFNKEEDLLAYEEHPTTVHELRPGMAALAEGQFILCVDTAFTD